MNDTLTLFHNSQCSKCSEVFSILTESKIPFEVVEYLKTPPSPVLIDSILKKLGKEPEEIVRTREDEYTDLGLAQNPPQTREEWIRLLSQHPILIERPIVVDHSSGVIGRPPQNVRDWLEHRKS